MSPPDTTLRAFVCARGHAVSITLTGEIDCSTVPVLTETIDAALDTGQRTVLLDLSGVAFMDSAGVRALATACTRASAAGVTIGAVEISPRVRRVLDITGVTALLAPEGDIAEAPTTTPAS